MSFCFNLDVLLNEPKANQFCMHLIQRNHLLWMQIVYDHEKYIEAINFRPSPSCSKSQNILMDRVKSTISGKNCTWKLV